MQARKCLYCGHEFELSFEEAALPPFLDEFLRLFKDTYDSEVYDKPLLQYTCTNCGLTLTQTDLEKDEERCRRQNDSRRSEKSSVGSTEEDTLDEAKGLLQKCLNGLEFDDYLKQSYEALDRQVKIQYAVCAEALDLLFRHGSPFQNPLEFALCRDLCRTAPLLLGYKDEINGRYQQLDVMISNVLHLHYFLPQNDPEQLLKTLTRLSEILLILGSLPMRCHTEAKSEHKPGYTDLTCRKRAAVIGALALRLEGLKDTPQGTEYLKLEQQLWHKVLEQGQELSVGVMLNVGGDAMSQLPAELRMRINSEIKRLNEMIIQRDSHFKPDKLPVQPFLYDIPASQKFIVAAVSFALLIGVISYLALSASAAIRLQKMLGKLSFLINFGVDGGEMIAILVYPLLFVFVCLFLEPRLLCLLYKIRSPR